MKENKGKFTLPGESGYEELTLSLAKRWGADAIRDSDGTKLSDQILGAGFEIYSTICIVRNHNEWAKKNPTKQQQSFLMTSPVVATREAITIPLMKNFFSEQFSVNEEPDSLKYWQVYDRTNNQELPRNHWSYDENTKSVTLSEIIPWHKYTVSFLVFRIWEEISMYNHTTNGWNSEHLQQINPVHPETQQYLLQWLRDWCEGHPETNVVRFTSLFYNFVWIWGSEENNRHLFTDWASYDFTVSPNALDQFAEKYGVSMAAEDFICKGNLRSTHTIPDQRKRQWMEFIGDFVIHFGRQLIEMVHSYGKKAYVFYDDSWVGLEPYSGKFDSFGFDGVIKCVFSGFEVRLCANVEVETHELRLHPYLFPTGLGGHATFMKGGNPKQDAQRFWMNVRRALLLQPIQRIGLGGYLHLVEKFPEFVDYIEELTEEFHSIQLLHETGKPLLFTPKIGIVTSWGKLRTWTLSGHFHETDSHDLIHILESLSGLPFAVEFFSFEEIQQGIPEDIGVIINAGTENSAWSGGYHWNSPELVENLTKWVHKGGIFLGVGEPSAVEGYDTRFRMAHVLGVDKGGIERACHGTWDFEITKEDSWVSSENTLRPHPQIYLTDGKAEVHMAHEKQPTLTTYPFGKGTGIYFSSFQYNKENTCLLRNSILWAAGCEKAPHYTSNIPEIESVYYPESKKLALVNNCGFAKTTKIQVEEREFEFTVPAFGLSIETIL